MNSGQWHNFSFRRGERLSDRSFAKADPRPSSVAKLLRRVDDTAHLVFRSIRSMNRRSADLNGARPGRRPAAALAAIFKNEDTTKPLSDQEVVKMLGDKGITIVRRTVVKYRGECPD